MSLDALAALLTGSTNATVERDFPLARLTTYKLGGPADLYVEPAAADDLEFLGRAIRASGLELT
ncbi:MAG: UDP-N-acetylmuramate dehydrogenase, partial [Actinomycetota bacterium]